MLILLKYCHENAEMQKQKFDDVTLRYSMSSPKQWKTHLCDLLVPCMDHVVIKEKQVKKFLNQ